jgi:hypothetical protein
LEIPVKQMIEPQNRNIKSLKKKNADHTYSIQEQMLRRQEFIKQKQKYAANAIIIAADKRYK